MYENFSCFLFSLQALVGTTIHVPTIDGRRIPLQLTSIVKPTAIRRIAGEGLPQPKQTHRRGDLVVEFDIRFPDHLSDGTREILADCLPKTK